MVSEFVTTGPPPAVSPLSVDIDTSLMSLLVGEYADRAPWETGDVATRADVEALEVRVRSLTAELEALHLSASWRLTAPLRSLVRRFPGLGRALRRTLHPVRRRVAGQFAAWLRRQRDAIAGRIFPERMAAREAARAVAVVLPESSREPERDPALAFPLAWAVAANPPATRAAAIVHLYYEELATEFRSCLEHIEEGIDVYISTCSDFQAGLIRSAFEGWDRGAVEVRVVPNRGRDIAPKLIAFKDVYARYAYVLHLHGKRSPHASVLAPWRQFMLENLVGDGEPARSAIAVMDALPDIGIVAVQHFEPVRHWLGWGRNFARSQLLAGRMGFSLDPQGPLDFPSGSMFWARSAALAPLLAMDLRIDDFEPEQGQKDGTLAHAIERLFFFACEHAGYGWLKVARPELYESTPRIESVEARGLLAAWAGRTRFRLLAPDSDRATRGVLEKMAGPSAAFVRLTQRRALGMTGTATALRVPDSVAIGLAARCRPMPEAQMTRAIAAALAALDDHAGSDPHVPHRAGTVWVLKTGGPGSGVWPGDARVRSVAAPDDDGIGIGAAHNRLMALAFDAGATHYVALDPAGILHSQAVSALMDMMGANRDRALVDALQFPRRHSKPYDGYNFETSWAGGGCLAIPRAAFEELGGFDEGFFMNYEDVDLSWRARAAGFVLRTCPRALFLRAVADRPHDLPASTIRCGDASRLSRKWGAPQVFDDEVLASMNAHAVALPRIAVEPVPAEWRRYADFEHINAT